MRDKFLSSDRKKYLRKIKLNKALVLITQIAILLSIILLWELLANLKIIDSFIASQPSRIFKTFMNLSSNDLLKHLGVTAYETIIGFTFGTLLGIVISIILWLSKFLSKVFEPFLVVLNSLPKVALRTNNNYMGRFWNFGNYSHGSCYIFNCNYLRYLTWILGNR